MKTIIAGSRGITDYSIVRQPVLESRFEITEIVSGGARGVDSLGERYARESNIPIKRSFLTGISSARRPESLETRRWAIMRTLLLLSGTAKARGQSS